MNCEWCDDPMDFLGQEAIGLSHEIKPTEAVLILATDGKCGFNSYAVCIAHGLDFLGNKNDSSNWESIRDIDGNIFSDKNNNPDVKSAREYLLKLEDNNAASR